MRENSPARTIRSSRDIRRVPAQRVGVVLEQVDVAADALVGQPLLGVDQQSSRPARRPIMGDQLDEVVAFGRRIFGWLPTSR